MKLEHLKLENFRGFGSFEITFDPSFTVLLGENMAGKSAVLAGASVALGALFDPFADPEGSIPYRDINEHEIRKVVADIAGVPDLQKQLPVSVTARVAMGHLGPSTSTWRRTRSAIYTQTFGDGSHDSLNGALATQPPVDLPIIAHYGTQRMWRGRESAAELRGVGSRSDGYTGCFDIASTHSELQSWMRKQTLVQLQRGNGYVQPQLAAVEAAVKTCITGITRFWFDVQYDELRLSRSDADIQSFEMLSEGVRNMVAMVADIAWRAAVLNPQQGAQAHLHAEGVVLIDELDLHLHPAWQRRVAGDLRRTFPRIQFIVTTHSPQIVASVSRGQVRLLENNQVIAEDPHVEGRDSNAILEDVFGVPARPEEVERELSALYGLIEDEDFAAARARLAALQARLGPDDAAMVRARWILDTEDAPAADLPATP